MSREKASLVTILFAVAVAAGGAGGDAVGSDLRMRPIEDRVLARVQEARVAAGATRLDRREILDRVAAERAGRVAALPADRRLADPWNVGSGLERAGVVRWKRAWHRLALLTGPDPVDRLSEQWRALPEAWSHATSAATSAVGVAGVHAADGTFVFVAVLVEDLPPMPEPAVLERAVLDSINRIRVEHGLVGLVPDEALSRIAREHSEAMRSGGFFDHRDPIGRGPGDRLKAAGVRYRKVAENLEFNHRAVDPAEVAAGHWMASPGHRKNLLGTSFVRTGVGIALTEDGGVWITQLFVTP